MITHEILGDDMQAVVISMTAGESLFLTFFASLTGPGRVRVPTLPFSRLADRVLSAFHGSREEVRRGDLAALGDLISGDR